MVKISAKTKRRAAIVFITLLIWAWAEKALNKELSDTPATIVAESTDPKLWASFSKQPSVDLKITLSGPAAKIAEVRRNLRSGEQGLSFYFDIVQEKKTEPGEYPLDLLTFLQKSSETREQGLKVISCEPTTLSVQVVKLVSRSITVECLDENRIPIKLESIEPAMIDMLVREDWSGEQLKAEVVLAQHQIEQARLAAITVKPYIELVPGTKRYTDTPVSIKLAPIQERLQEYVIPTTIGTILSENLQGKYTVELQNRSDIPSAIKIKATQQAQLAYRNRPFKMLLEIQDGDETAEGSLTRQLVPNFPAEHVRKDEIILNQQPIKARFKLTALPAPVQ